MEVDGVFIPRFFPLNHHIAPEHYQGAIDVSASQLVGKCPRVYKIEQEMGVKPLPEPESRRFFLPGLAAHWWRELANRGDPFSVIVEEQLYLVWPGDEEHKPVRLRVTPDRITLDARGVFVEDYKTTSEAAMYYKFQAMRKGLPWENRMQLSLQAYALYVTHGIEVQEGRIVYINRDNPRATIAVPDRLFTLDETEKFVLGHPLILKNMEDKAFKSYIFSFQEKKAYMCDYCDAKYAKECPFKRSKDEIKESMKREVKKGENSH